MESLLPRGGTVNSSRGFISGLRGMVKNCVIRAFVQNRKRPLGAGSQLLAISRRVMAALPSSPGALSLQLRAKFSGCGDLRPFS